MKDLLYLLGMLVQFGSSNGGQTCYDMSTFPYWKDCNDGCCGDYAYQTCCKPTSDITVIIAISVGSAIGGILIISFIICIICVCIKRPGKSGRVIAPNGTEQSTVFTTASAYPAQGYYNNPVSYPYPQPPAYGQPSFAPPAYGTVPSAPTVQTTGNTGLAADGYQHGGRHPPPQASYMNPTN